MTRLFDKKHRSRFSLEPARRVVRQFYEIGARLLQKRSNKLLNTALAVFTRN